MAIADIVLQAAGDPVGGGDIIGVALLSLHIGSAQCSGEQGVLAVGLPEPRPERLAAGVEDGIKVPGDTGGAHLDSSDFSALAQQIGVPGRGHADGLGENGRPARIAGAMDAVDAVKYRDFKPALARHILDLADDLVPAFKGVGMGANIEKGPCSTVQNGLAQFLAIEHQGLANARAISDTDDFDGELGHLPDLLLQRHLVKEVLHPHIDGRLAKTVDR